MKYFDSFILRLNEFCHRKLQDESFVKYNKAKAKIFKKTIRLIDEYDTNENPEKLWGYVGDHIGWYWD